MKKNQIFDDYYTDGKIELAKIDKFIAMRSHYTQNEIFQRNKYKASHYDEVKSEIDALIMKIREEILCCDPLQLLMCSTDYSMRQISQVISESHMNFEQANAVRLTEYIQSILVSQDGNYSEISTDEDYTDKIFVILNDIKTLYEKCIRFYTIWASKAEVDKTYSADDITYIVEAQLMNAVRGKRYQFQQLKDLEALIKPHSSKMMDLYGMSSETFLEGLHKLEYSLSGAKVDSYKMFFESYKIFCEKAESLNGENLDSVMDTISNELEQKRVMEKCFGTDLYDVAKVTGWSNTFIRKMSYSLGEATGFFDSGEFSGWPGQDLPVQKRPFIIIGETAYCFDYYNLFDNIYRILQKNMRELDPSYTNTWSELQSKASENLVAKKLKTILPNSKVYVGNYYPENTSLKKMDENDVLAVCDDVILIVEVKAGSFTYTPALTDFQAHQKSFETLIEKADVQCVRTLNYILNNSKAIFYDKDKNEKFSVYAENKKIYTLCITVDNFNVFEAKIEKTQFFKMNSGTIAISLDDLGVYEEYFDSELCFLHFLKQRTAATRIKNLMLNDELDHLGLYIENNTYANYIRQFKDCGRFMTVGFREDLDKYFAGLHNEALKCEKPRQYIPTYIKRILEYLEKNTIVHRVRISDFLLDLSPESKKEFNEQVERKRLLCKKRGNITPFYSEGEFFDYFCFVSTTGITEDYFHRRKYIYANLMDRRRPKCWDIEMDLDSLGYITNLYFEEIRQDQYLDEGYSKEEIEGYLFYLKEHRKANGIRMPQAKKVKIYPNEYCPCGSGKKYKKCCGKS